MADAGASPQPQSLSFTQGFLLGQLSIVILIGAFIKFFIFGDPPSADATAAARATARRQRTLAHRRSLLSISSSSSTAPQQRSLRRKRSNVLRNTPPSTISSILSKTYYNVNAHQPESLDWFNVLVAQTIAQFRSDAQHDDALLKSLNDVLNGPQRPDFLSEIKVTEIEMGEEFPIFSNCRIIPVDEHGFGISAAGQGSHGWGEGNRLQARMDVDLSDSITLGVETKLVLNYPKPMVAVLPVALAVSVVRFSGTLSISFIPSSPSTPSRTTLAFSFLDDYRLDLSVRSLVGSRSRLQDVPKIAQVVEALLHSWFDERCVEPRFQQIALPSFWPRKRNTRGGETEQEDGITMSAGAQKNVERDLREEARREIEAEQLAAKERIAALEREGLRWRLLSRQTQADGEASYTMPGTLLHDE